MELKTIQEAYDMVASGKSKRVDGEGYIVYQVGTIIRIDIKEEG